MAEDFIDLTKESFYKYGLRETELNVSMCFILNIFLLVREMWHLDIVSKANRV